jgi:4-hydroxybenzoate polyprenyl transferase
MLPCWWGIAFFGWQDFSLRIVILTALGAFLLRGAGCTINDWFDQDFDRHNQRTRNRPLAAGLLSPNQAFGFLTIQLIVGAGVLWLMPYRSWPFAFASSGLMVIYPLMKRMTNYPQVILGLTFNMGVWIGASAVNPSYLDHLMALSLLYLIGVCWTLGYDTIYALQDKEDDIRLGIGSTTIAFGRYVKLMVAIFYGIALLLSMVVGVLSGRSWFYYVMIVTSFSLIEMRLWQLDSTDKEACDDFFKINIWLGFFIFVSLLVG